MTITGIPFSIEIRKTGPSEKWREEAKIILSEIDITTPAIGKRTLSIVSGPADFKLPAAGEQIRFRTQTQLNLISLIVKIVRDMGRIDELTVATYTLNKEAFAVFEDLTKSGRILKLNLLIASSYNFREPKWSEKIKRRVLKMKNANLAFAWFHWKIFLARCGNNFYQCEGSMNFSQNNMAEQLLFENNREVYEHDYHLLTEKTLTQNTKAVEIVKWT